MATAVAIHEGCKPGGRPAASVAKKRGDGGRPDGHDPEARPGSAPLLANTFGYITPWPWCFIVQTPFSNRHAMPKRHLRLIQES